MNFFSIIILMIIICILLMNRTVKKIYISLFSMACIIEIYNLQGYFLLVGSSEFRYEMFVSFILLFFSIMIIAKGNIYISKRLFLWIIIFVSSLVMGILMEIFYPYQGLVVNGEGGGWDAYAMGLETKEEAKIYLFVFIRVFVNSISMILSILMIEKYIYFNDLLKIVRIVNKYIRIPLYLGLLEVVFKNIFQLDFFSGFYEIFFGLGTSTVIDMRTRGDFYILQGFTKEPSHFAWSLFLIAILLLLEYKLKKREKLRYILEISICIILSFFSGAFSAVPLFLCFILSFISLERPYGFTIYRIFKKFFSIVFFISIFIVFCININDSYFYQRLENIIYLFDYLSEDKWDLLIGSYAYTSAIPRIVSMIDTLSDFFYRPLWGLGIGVQSAFSGVITMLSAIGIVGLISWTKCVTYQKNKKDYDWLVFATVILLPNLFAGWSWFFYYQSILLLCTILKYKNELYDAK